MTKQTQEFIDVIELLRQHIKDVDRRFEDIGDNLNRLTDKIDNLTEFKFTTIASARTTSLIVSAVCGFITLVATVALAWYSKQ